MTLLAPLFLAGLIGIGLPLWLHRLSSENPNRKPFSSLMFLEAGEPQRVLARNVQYLLLLAMRIAVLVLLVFAFMQPAYWRTPEPAGADGARQHVIVLDLSASMAAGNRWGQALDATEDLIDTLPAGDPVQLIGAGRTLELITAPTQDRAVLRQSLAGLTPGVFHVDFGQVTGALDGVLRASELPSVVHFVTDAQNRSLPTPFAELVPGIPAEIEVHSVGASAVPNWAIESLSGSAVSGELVATVHGYTDADRAKRLRLMLNGRTVAEEPIDVGAGQTVAVGFPPLELEEGANRVRVNLVPNDDLRVDDERVLALNRPVPRPVLVVSGGLRSNDTLYIAEAMATLDALALEVEASTVGDLNDRVFADYALIVVAEAGVLTNAIADRLQSYVDQGGGLLLALGPRSTSLTTIPVTGQVFSSGTRSLVSGATDTSIGAMDSSHPILRGLDTLRGALFSGFSPVTPADDDRVLISLETGAPLLIERSLGNGRVLLFTSSLSREWNDLPLQPVFVPFVARLADYLLGGAGFSNEAALGTTLALRAMGMQGGQIFDPSGEPALGLGGGTDGVLLDQIGFYELVGGGRTELVAVNFDTRESDLAAADADTQLRWQGLGQRVEGGVSASGVVPDDVLTPLGRWFLVFLLLAAAVETWAGNWHLRVRRGLAT